MTAYIAALDATAGASPEAPAAPAPGRFRRMLGPIWGWKVPKRAAYVALQFPLGLAYFVAIAVVFSTGGALAWSIPGLALILLGVIASRWAGDLEAWLARRLVGTEIRRPPTWYEKDVPKREQAKQVLTDPSTWTGLVYLGSHLVTGVVALVVFSVLSATSVLFSLAPMLATGVGPFDEPHDAVINFGDSQATDVVFNFGSLGTIDSAGETLWFVPLGLLGIVATAYSASGWAVLHARWARLMLGSRARDIPASPALLEDGPVAEPVTQDVRIAALTSREREVLLLMARGYSNAEIAEAFVVSEGTVKTHVKRILAKLEVRDRTQAAVFAFDSGFVTPALASEPEPR